MVYADEWRCILRKVRVQKQFTKRWQCKIIAFKCKFYTRVCEKNANAKTSLCRETVELSHSCVVKIRTYWCSHTANAHCARALKSVCGTTLAVLCLITREIEIPRKKKTRAGAVWFVSDFMTIGPLRRTSP